MTRLAAIARRQRFGQAILFAMTVCLLVGTASVDPLLSRSFSQAVVRFHGDAEGVIGSQVEISATGVGSATPEEFERRIDVPRLEGLLDARVKAVVGAPQVTRSGVTQWHQAGQPVTVRSTQGQCGHVTILDGRCPRAFGEVLVSQQTQRKGLRGVRVGSVVTLGDDVKYAVRARVVGIYKASTADPAWHGEDIGAYDASATGSVTTLLATPATVGQTVEMTVAVSYPVRASALTPGALATAAAGARAMSRLNSATVFQSLDQVYQSTRSDVHQVGKILPYLLLQLAIVLLILLVQVAAFLATVRRGEAAVLKMRGNGTGGVVRLGAHEFLPSFVVGVVAGLGLAYVVDALVRHLWLPGNVAAAWNWTSLIAALSMAAVVALVWSVCWWLTAREPISSLLRSRPPRRGKAGLSMPAAVLGALCLVGVVLTATKSLTGAPVQVTPVLLAGLIAIVVGALLAPAAGWLVRRLLARGRSSGALAVAQLGRRAGVVTAVTTLIITSALLTLSLSVVARGADNREARTAADLGSAALVQVTIGAQTMHGQDLIAAVNSVDPKHRDFTPAVQINSSSPTSNAVLGVIPADMQRIGAGAGLQQPVPWSDLEHEKSADKPAALVSTWTTDAQAGATVTAPTMADVDGEFRVAGAVPYIPGAGDRTVVVDQKTMLAAGERQDSISYQVFSATQDPKRVAQLDRAIRKAGFASTQVQKADEVNAGYAATATAWAGKLSIVVSVLAVLAALMSVVLVAVASRRDRERDLRALRTGGVRQAVLRRATVSEFVLLALVGSVIGALTVPLAARLIGPTMLWWSTPPKQPVTQTGFEWRVGTLGAVGLVVLLVVVGAVFGMRVARGSAREEFRPR